MDQNTNYNNSTSYAAEILSVLFSLGCEEVDDSEFIQEVLGENTEEIVDVAKDLNKLIDKISNDRIKKIATPIIMEVVNVHSDYTVDLIKPNDEILPENLSSCSWTNVCNPTIFKYLEKGDRVLVGHNDESCSSCWVMFALIPGDKYEEKTIYKDFEKIYDINYNTNLLKECVERLAPIAFPPIPVIDSEGNVTYEENPKYTLFLEDMRKWKKVDRR